MRQRPSQRPQNVRYYAANRESEIARVRQRHRVTRMINGDTDRMLAEASKCDIVCANCHRLRTFARRTKRSA